MNDLSRFRMRNPSGTKTFNIPLKPDEEGMVGRECPLVDCQPRYFKIGNKPTTETLGNDQTKTEAENSLFCPYCGHEDHHNRFATREQIEWAKSLVIRQVHKDIDNMFRRTIGSAGTSSSSGLIRLRLEYKSGTLPSVRHYAEKELKRTVNCDHCGGKYAVYGIAMFCPFCGKGNLKVHLRRSCEVIQSLMNAHDQIVEKAGKEVGHNLLGNCLEDCVSIFEGFLKKIYARELNARQGPDVLANKISKLSNSFQNLTKANSVFKDDLAIDLLSVLSSDELDFMALQFAKRHVITHSLGLVDAKFSKQAATWQTSGQDVNLSTQDIQHLLSLVEKVIQSICG